MMMMMLMMMMFKCLFKNLLGSNFPVSNFCHLRLTTRIITKFIVAKGRASQSSDESRSGESNSHERQWPEAMTTSLTAPHQLPSSQPPNQGSKELNQQTFHGSRHRTLTRSRPGARTWRRSTTASTIARSTVDLAVTAAIG
jgi:hypothetical protein